MLLHGSLQLHAYIQVYMRDVSSYMRSCHIKLFDSWRVVDYDCLGHTYSNLFSNWTDSCERLSIGLICLTVLRQLRTIEDLLQLIK